MSALLPCPFCGSRRLNEPHECCDYVECDECGAFGPGAPLNMPKRDRVAVAYAAWNHRAPIEGTVTDPSPAAASQLAMSEQEVRENSQISDLLTGDPKSQNTEGDA